MTFYTQVADDFSEAMKYGQLVRFRYFDIAINGSYYDDDALITQTGSDYWTSGLVQPINTTRGSNDAVKVEIGRLQTNDSKLYVAGVVPTSGIFKVGIGSPVVNEYAVTEQGIQAWQLNGSIVYKKLYIRNLVNPSGANNTFPLTFPIYFSEQWA